MKIKYVFYSCVFIPFIVGCTALSNAFSNGPEIVIKKDFDGNGIAVLNFSKYGPIPADIGNYAADKLTDSFFLNTKLSVIERARVNDAQASLEITNTEFLSSEQILKLGQKLKANYLVLGRVHCISEEDYFKSCNDKKLSISFRIVSVASQDVVGVVNYSCNYEEKLVEKMQDMITQITSKIIEN